MGRSGLSRRELLIAAPALLGLSPRLIAQGRPFQARAMNHVTLTVADVQRSLKFYQGLFGLPVVATQGATPILRVGAGPQFIALNGAPATTPRIDHVCLTVEDFEADSIMKRLADLGVQPAAPPAGTGPGALAGGLAGGALRARVRMRGENAGGAKEGTPEIYFGDPDGITIQLQAVSYCGGAGVLGEVCSTPPKTGTPRLVTRAVNHVTLTVSDPKRSLDFYQRTFGLPIVARQAAIPILRIGSGPAFIALNGGGNQKPGIHHVCLTIEDFDVDRTMKALADVGVTKTDDPSPRPMTARVRMRGPENGGAKEGTPELYFTDPDGITIQLQDVRYCGGSGTRGEICAAR